MELTQISAKIVHAHKNKESDMFSLIGSIFKYAFLSVLILVGSHIVQVGNVSISDHVGNALKWAKVEATYSLESVTSISSSSEFSSEDRESLNDTIKNASKKRR